MYVIGLDMWTLIVPDYWSWHIMSANYFTVFFCHFKSSRHTLVTSCGFILQIALDSGNI